MTLPVLNPEDSANFQLDWSDVLPDGVTLGTVTHSVPAPLTKVSESTDVGGARSTVRVSGGVHGRHYMVSGQTTLSNGEVLNRPFTVPCFNG